MDYSNVPKELQDLPQWAITVGTDKAPKTWDTHTNALHLASVTNPSTWLSFSNSVSLAAHIAATTQQQTYIGFIFTANDPYGCIDLDNKTQNPDREVEFQEIIRRACSYTEVSLSGKGYHIVVKGNIGKGLRNDSKGVELYTQERFIIFTNVVYLNKDIINGDDILSKLAAHMRPSTPQLDLPNPEAFDPDPVVINKIQKSGSALKFNDHFENDWSTHSEQWQEKYKYSSASEADAALSMIITFYTQNQQQAERIFKLSALYRHTLVRKKGPNYLRDTIYSARQKQAHLVTTQQQQIAQVNMGGFMDAANKMLEDHRENSPLMAISLPELRLEALHGVLGYIAQVGSQYSEAVPVALAINTLTRFCAMLGRKPFIEIGDEDRSLRPYVLIIGPTGIGRKGTSTAFPNRLFKEVESLMYKHVRTITSFSSGEGVINLVRDAEEDEVQLDKKVYFEIPEFSGVLTQIKRDSNILASTLRDAWDGRTLHVPNKNSPCKSTDPHIVISSHITKEELNKALSKTDIVNGFLNRFMMVYCIRDKVVDRPAPVPNETVNMLANWIKGALEIATAREDNPIMFTDAAVERWIEIKHDLESRQHSEHIGPLMIRASAYVWMLSAAIALINQVSTVDVEHLNAALAWVDYWQETAEFCFIDTQMQTSHSDIVQMSDAIVESVIKLGGKGITQNELRKDLTKHNCKPEQTLLMHQAIRLLQNESPPRVQIKTVKPKGKGRPTNLFSVKSNHNSLGSLE
jgi:hypothetical protein